MAVMGTLKKGGSNHRLLSTSEFIGSGSTLPIFGMKSLGGFPSLIEGNQEAMVEVYHIDEATLSRLDSLEGYRPDGSSFFTREQVPITLDNGIELVAWLYWVADPLTIKSNPDYTVVDQFNRLNWSY